MGRTAARQEGGLIMSARDSILKKVRTSLGAAGDPGERARAVAERLAAHVPGVIPARGQLDSARRIKLFVEMAERANATVQRVRSGASVPKAVAAYLRGHNLPASIRIGADPRLDAMPWAEQKALAISRGASDGYDEVGVSHAFGGIAETGTLMLTSGPDNPTTINFLPDHHIVVMDEGDVAGDLEALWAALRASGKGMPRTVNLVTGPSRSGDIEQTLLLGAHGPRALHVILVAGSGS
jgi:L-lactate dehydrogenase complex protein LldG